ncbi:hypothetical protein ACFQ8C_11900 [Streptomyces sp. NPDC056503]|uniref:hypothetical protein n=1 Tax=Streptomyces sp. NPDC056503 TaxID=3345842 RepID=UPI003686DFC0
MRRTTTPASARALARLLPALLCALCAFLVAPASADIGTGVPTVAVAEVAPAPTAPDTHVSAAETAELPAVVEQSVRFHAPPVAPPVVRDGTEAPVRGRVAGDPRRERAPPGLPHHLAAPRGPPSTRHS